MSRLVGFDTHRFSLGGEGDREEWVDVRDKLSWLEQQEMNAAMFDVQAGVDGEVKIQPVLGRAATARLKSYVTGWHLYGPDGQLVPFSAATLLRLDHETVTAILAHVEELEAAASPEKKASEP
jgi:hypothetical protein